MLQYFLVDYCEVTNIRLTLVQRTFLGLIALEGVLLEEFCVSELVGLTF